MSLAIICPTRGRPHNCARMIDSALNTSDAEILLYIDHDDPERPRYCQSGPRVHVQTGPPIGRGAAINALCEGRTERAYLLVSDDLVFIRNGWDQECLAALDEFPSDIGLVHLASELDYPWVSWPLVSRHWLDAVGWFNFPGGKWFCQDTALSLLGDGLGRVKKIEPQVVHHDRINSPDQSARIAADMDAFLWWCAKDFGATLAKLKAAS